MMTNFLRTQNIFPIALVSFVVATVCSCAVKDYSVATDPPCIDEELKCPDCLCAAVYEPVCGCNGKTYSNACEAKKDGVTDYEPCDP